MRLRMVLLAGLGVVFATAKSDGVRVACVGLLALPLLAAASPALAQTATRPLGECHEQDAVGHRDAEAHDRADEALNVERRARQLECQKNTSNDSGGR